MKRGIDHHSPTDEYTWWRGQLSQLSPKEQKDGAQKTEIQWVVHMWKK